MSNFPRPLASDLTLEEFLLVYPRMSGADGEGDPAPEPVGIQPVENPGPWDADIRALASDQATYESLDQYARSQQSYISTIEEENAAARALYEDLANDPAAAIHALTEAVYDEDQEKVNAIAAVLGIQLEDITVTEPTTPAEPVITPEMQEAIDFARDSKNEKAYNDAVTWAKNEVGDEFEAAYFHPHMVIAEGDPAKALESYRNWDASVKERYAPKTHEPTPRVPAPTTLGADGAALPTPTTPNDNTMEAAFKGMFDDMRAARGANVSPVGSV